MKTIDNSTIRFSTIDNSTTDNSTINYSTLRSTNDNDSTIDNSTLTLSNTCSSNIDNSTINNSTVCYSTITNSTIDNSTITNSIISNSNIDNSTISNTTISNKIYYLHTVNGSVAPTAAGIAPYEPANGATDIAQGTMISITFSESMDPSTFTTNTSNTNCTGTFQVSSDSNFGNCVQMESSPSASNGNKTFTVDPDGKLDKNTLYYIRITIQVTDAHGNNLSAQILISFRTVE